jgi:hypothetical protein
MSGSGDDDNFFSSEIVLVIGAVVGVLLLLQAGFVASVGEWLGHMMADGIPFP